MAEDAPTILRRILARKREEVAERSQRRSIADLQRLAAGQGETRGFAGALVARYLPV